MAVVQVTVFGLTLWFGCYLAARSSKRPGLRYAGWGLIAYAGGLAYLLLEPALPVSAIRPLALLFPGLFWLAAIYSFRPNVSAYQVHRLFGASAALTAVTLAAALLLDALTLVVFVPIGGLLFALISVLRHLRELPRRPLIILLVATTFFVLSLGLLLLPTAVLMHTLVFLGASGDLLLLGYALAGLDAYEEGTLLWRDLLRSFTLNGIVALVFGGQVVISLHLLGLDAAALVIGLPVIATAITLVTLFDRLQAGLDRLTFPRQSDLSDQRAELRSVGDAVLRVNPAVDFTTLSSAEFTRYTRQALSHAQNLDKLATSPLTYLPLIDQRLAARGADASLLERAKELRALLRDSIDRLKPHDGIGFTDEWRYYNVLYFPYIAGLKPYSRRVDADDLDPAARQALDWFANAVPERTLYNWQATGAKLVAQDLRDQLERLTTP